MKKTILFLLLSAVLLSCNDSKPLQDNQGYPKPFSFINEPSAPADNVIVLGSDKHDYLLINWGTNGQCFIHYIDCELCLKRAKVKEIPKQLPK